jgi:5-methylthioadenosine/S-adenosylhomocysteine deaminase
MKKKILIHNGSIRHETEWLTPGTLIIQDGRIQSIRPGNALPEEISQAEVVLDARGMAVMPGLVNGHTHFSQTFMRGLAGGRPLLQWLKELIWPLQAAMSVSEMYLASLLGLAENLRCGVTEVIDHHKVTRTRDFTRMVKQAAGSVGLRCTIAWAWSNQGAKAEADQDILSELGEWFGQASEGAKINFASGPLTPWRCSAELLQKTHALARERDTFTHIHVSETVEEVQMTVDETGMRPVEWLDRIGVLDERTQIVHAVWVDDREIELLAQRQATVVHCPVSNAVLGSGIAPVGKMLASGVSMRLGTDGPASNDTQDCFENMKMALCLGRAGHHNADYISNEQALEMALASRTLKVGAPAEMILVNLNNLRAAPVHDISAALTLCSHGDDVDTVIVDGEILMRAGKILTVDVENLLKECERAIRSLRKRAGVD